MIPKNKDPMWVSKEFAEDYGLEWDILIKPRYFVHLNDPNTDVIMNRYYREQERREWNRLSLWGKIKCKVKEVKCELE